MRAAVVSEYSQPPAWNEFADPEPADGEVMGEVVAAAVSNFARAIAGGAFYASDARPPLVAGADGVARLQDGSLVYVPRVRAPWGTLAERVAVPLAGTAPLPDGLSPVQAAAVVNPAMSSWLPLTRALEPGATPTVLVLGATGASGRVAVQVAKHLGARRVIAVGREGAALRRLAEHGADELVPIDEGLASAAQRVGAEGVDVVLDYLWGDAAAQVQRALVQSAPHPRYRIDWINVGALGGPTVPLEATLLRMADLHISGSGAFAHSPERRQELVETALDLALRGVIGVDVEERRLADIESTWSDRGRLVYVP